MLFKVFPHRTLGVSAIVTGGTGVWFVRHSYRSGLFLPGGAVKAGESFTQALRRELGEELGITLTGDHRVIGAYRHDEAGYIVVFEVTAWEGEPHPVSAEIDEVVHASLDELPDDVSPATRRRLAEWQSGDPPGDRW